MPTTSHAPGALTAFLGLYLAGSLWAWTVAIGRIRRGRPLLPSTPARSVPWGAGSVVLVALLYVGLMTFVPAIVHPSSKANHPAEAGVGTFSPDEMLLIVAIVNAIVIVTVPLVLGWTSGARPVDLGLSTQGIGTEIVRGAVACLLIAPPVYFAYGIAMTIWGQRPHALEQMIRTDPSPTRFLLAFVTGVILATIAEELLFRGVLQGWLTSLWERTNPPLPTHEGETERGPMPNLPATPSLADGPDLDASPPETMTQAIRNTPRSDDMPGFSGHARSTPERASMARFMPNVLTSILFAITHAPQWPAPVAIFILSIGLGAVYRSSGRLIGPIVLHLVFNGSSTLLLFLSVVG